jgi:pimeloyl-ACP methyl ester carboxylesterase
VLYCHGNAGNVERWARPARALWEALGESVLIFDYPGYGYSGGEPSEAGCYAAADAAYDWLVHSQRVAPDRIVI